MPAAEASELEARAELDDAVWRDIEEVGRCTGVTRHEAEQALAPPHHRGRTGRRKSRAVHVIGRLLSLPLDAEITAEDNDLPHVGPFHEPVVSPDAMESLRQRLDDHTLLMLHLGYLLRNDREQDDLLVEGLVVPEVALEDQRRAIDVVAQEDRGAAHARWLRTLDLIEEVIHRDRGLRQESAAGRFPDSRYP